LEELLLITFSMTNNNNSLTQAPRVKNVVTVNVSSRLVGRSLADVLRRSISIGDQEELGDNLMDRSRDLLRSHLQLIELDTQRIIRERILDVRRLKEGLENHTGNDFQRLLKARKYRRHSRKVFKIVKSASDRATEDSLLAQIVEATRGPEVTPGGGGGGESRNNLGTATTRSDPFGDSHAISMLTDIHVDDLDEIELSTFKNEEDSDAAAVLDLTRRDGSTQHLVATFPVEAFSGDRADGEAATALSIHGEDGISPRLVLSPLSYLSPGDHTNQDETVTISSVALTEVHLAS